MINLEVSSLSPALLELYASVQKQQLGSTCYLPALRLLIPNHDLVTY